MNPDRRQLRNLEALRRELGMAPARRPSTLQQAAEWIGDLRAQLWQQEEPSSGHARLDAEWETAMER